MDAGARVAASSGALARAPDGAPDLAPPPVAASDGSFGSAHTADLDLAPRRASFGSRRFSSASALSGPLSSGTRWRPYYSQLIHVDCLSAASFLLV